MIGRFFLGTACALAATLAALASTRAQTVSSQSALIEEWARDITVLTMAPNGAWGTTTD